MAGGRGKQEMTSRPAAEASFWNSTASSGGRSTRSTPSTPAGNGIDRKLRGTVPEHRVEISHQHNRYLGAAPHGFDHRENFRQCGPGGKCPFRGFLDGRAVRHRVGKGNPQFDNIRLALFQGQYAFLRNRKVRVTSSNKGNEGFFPFAPSSSNFSRILLIDDLTPVYLTA